jgi:hypothetical protein
VPVWDWVAGDYALTPPKPTLDLEPNYEDHPYNPWPRWDPATGYFRDHDVRKQVYRSVFAGACGVTYGHHHIWQFLNTELYKPITNGDTLIPWKKAVHAEAAGEMQYLKKLMLSRPYFSRIGDQSLIQDPGSTYVDLVYATRDEQNSYAMIYLPQNKPVNINLSKVYGTSKNVWWFDPRTGLATKGESANGNGIQIFTPPKMGKDWVLVIDDAAKNFSPPGTDVKK